MDIQKLLMFEAYQLTTIESELGQTHCRPPTSNSPTKIKRSSSHPLNQEYGIKIILKRPRSSPAKVTAGGKG